jgi:hypothetical protein
MTAIDNCLLTMDYLYTFHKNILRNLPPSVYEKLLNKNAICFKNISS